MLDNSEIIAGFCPPHDNGDSFIYTEMLDRSKGKGNNGHRLVKTFYHRSVEEFWQQMPVIRQLCDMTQTRAYTRLAMRSYKSVGEAFTRLVVDAAPTDNWAGMKSLYNRACGIVSPTQKLWLFDVDVINLQTELFEIALRQRNQRGEVKNPQDDSVFVSKIPSKKGLHYITKPFDISGLPLPPDVSLHKDNPTNLYIPEGAA